MKYIIQISILYLNFKMYLVQVIVLIGKFLDIALIEFNFKSKI